MPKLLHFTIFSKTLYVLVLAMACCGSTAGAQDLPAALQSAVDSLLRQGEIRSHENRFQDSTVLAISELATFEELLVLSRHPTPLIRVAALYGLLQRDENGLPYPAGLQPYPRPIVTKPYLHQVLEERFDDTATVRWRMEWKYYLSTPKSMRVGEFYLLKIGNYRSLHSISFNEPSGYQLPKAVSIHFDSLLLLRLPNPWTALRFALVQRLEAIPAWYPAVRRAVKHSGDEPLVCYLAKYRRPKDIDLILALLPAERSWAEFGLHSRWLPFQYFRHPRMFAYLRQHLPADYRSTKTLDFIAAYRSPDAASLLDSMYMRVKASGQSPWTFYYSLGRALGLEFSPIYAPLFWKLLNEDPEHLHLPIPDQLWETHADSLVNGYERWKTGGRGARERATAMFPKLSAYLARQDAEHSIRVVAEQIKPGKPPREAQKALEIIWQARDPAYTDFLFALLLKEPLPENRFFLTKIILHQPEPENRQRLGQFFQQHPGLRPRLADAENGGAAFSDFHHYVTQKK